MSTFGSIEQAVADIAAGRPVVVVDDEDRENEEIGRASCRERVCAYV